MNKRTKGPNRERMANYLWMAPGVVLIVLFLVWPTLQTINLSLHQKITFSESMFREDLLRELQAAGGRTVDLAERIQEIPGWERAVDKIAAGYGIAIPPGEITSGMTVRNTAEMLTVLVNQARRGQGGIGPQRFAGLKNYLAMLKDAEMLIAFRNNLYWLVLFTIFTVVTGLLIAALADKVGWGTFAKTMIFLPMAISGAAAGVIWYFMYQKDPGTGTINALIGLFVEDFQGIAFLGRPDLVTFALIVVGIWMQVGFCTVIFSAALRAIPPELIEMARIEGARSGQVFFRIELPYIWSTVVLVVTQMIMWVLKVFDIVFTMTHGGPFGASEVIANRIYRTEFNMGDFHYGSAMAVVLFLAIIPVLFLNIKNLSREESIRE